MQRLQAALTEAQEGDVCAQRGCQLTPLDAAEQTRGQGERGAAVAPWRDSGWEHPTVRALRTRVVEQAGEIDRLRVENGLLRRWISQRVDGTENRSREA